ncbi:PREDICTED: uncharacterized protein DDB_G0280205-like [Nicotiana attenuata]|uniref:uncharacterized protein DDB_G0280205-like n=1 Tax=Nicotiana attenuata TaxID=49451 RepID=UPI0009053D43|nr:PREDICTED: uncharacterized protein DDB_G0280205-like [Nicotiana attenuata]
MHRCNNHKNHHQQYRHRRYTNNIQINRYHQLLPLPSPPTSLNHPTPTQPCITEAITTPQTPTHTPTSNYSSTTNTTTIPAPTNRPKTTTKPCHTPFGNIRGDGLLSARGNSKPSTTRQSLEPDPSARYHPLANAGNHQSISTMASTGTSSPHLLEYTPTDQLLAMVTPSTTSSNYSVSSVRTDATSGDRQPHYQLSTCFSPTGKSTSSRIRQRPARDLHGISDFERLSDDILENTEKIPHFHPSKPSENFLEHMPRPLILGREICDPYDSNPTRQSFTSSSLQSSITANAFGTFSGSGKEHPTSLRFNEDNDLELPGSSQSRIPPEPQILAYVK